MHSLCEQGYRIRWLNFLRSRFLTPGTLLAMAKFKNTGANQVKSNSLSELQCPIIHDQIPRQVLAAISLTFTKHLFAIPKNPAKFINFYVFVSWETTIRHYSFQNIFQSCLQKLSSELFSPYSSNENATFIKPR